MNHETKSGSKTKRADCSYMLACVVLVLCSCDAHKTQTNTANPTNATTAVRPVHQPLTIPAMSASVVTVIAIESAPQFATAQASLTLTASTNSIASATPEPPVKRGSVNLSWVKSPETNIAGYRIFYGTNSGSYYASATVSNVTSAKLSGLNEGVQYYAAVSSVNRSGVAGEFSNEVSFTTPFYISIRHHIWSVEAFGAFGRTNQIKSSTNLSEWWTILEWIGNSNLTNVLHTNVAQAWFRVEAR